MSFLKGVEMSLRFSAPSVFFLLWSEFEFCYGNFFWATKLSDAWVLFCFCFTDLPFLGFSRSLDLNYPIARGRVYNECEMEEKLAANCKTENFLAPNDISRFSKPLFNSM